MIKFSYMTSFYNKKIGRYVPSPYITPLEADDWKQFSDELQRMQDIKYERKDFAPLISPAYYDVTPRRKNDNVSGWSFLALDFDNGSELTFDDCVVWLEELGFTFVIYTTASSKPEHHKFRVFIPFTRNVEPEEMNTVWAGAFEYFGRLTDPVCKDKSRGYYVPGTYPGAYTDFAVNYAKSIEPELLKSYAPPEPAKILQTTTFVNSGIDYRWTGLDDCPFIKQRWIDDYMNLPSGQDMHYQALYKFMLRVAGAAKHKAHVISAHNLALLASELDGRKDNRWTQHGRSWDKEAANAVNYVYGGN